MGMEVTGGIESWGLLQKLHSAADKLRSLAALTKTVLSQNFASTLKRGMQ